jgi:protocatechuate 3,4-dioxygenase alpha subunit
MSGSQMNTPELVAIPSQTVGPFFDFALTTNRSLGMLAAPGVKGERIRLRLRMLDGEGAPVPDGIFELWQADAEGRYCHPADARCADADAAFCGFGRLGTDDAGECTFETIRPGRAENDGSPHINVIVFSRGLLSHLYTRIYFEDDPALSSDPVLALVPVDRRRTVIAHRLPDATWTHDIRLQGETETVFFDL